MGSRPVCILRRGCRCLIASNKRQLHSKLLPNTAAAYIDGKWTAAAGGQSFDVTNPATGQTIARSANCGIDEASTALAAARAAYEHWGFQTTARERATLLTKWFNLMTDNKDELARILTMEQVGLTTSIVTLQPLWTGAVQGKPLAEAQGEIAYGASFFDWFAAEARRLYGEVVPPAAVDRVHFHFREPLGVAVMITPWNFPTAMITRKVGAALAAGCTTVVKPAEDTPLSALALATLADEAGIPPGVFNVLTADREQSAAIGTLCCESPLVDVVSFTGSTAVGKVLLHQSAATVKRVCLELGGNAPFMVFNSADLNKAVQGAMASKFRASGQTCVCANRFLVQSGVYDSFLAKLKEAMGVLKVGNGLDDGVNQGPLINKRATDKVVNLVSDAQSKGARVLLGGKRLNANFYEPTLLADVTANMEIGNTEIFGPVAAVRRFESEEEGLKIANDTRMGLAGYFYSQDVAQIFRVSRRLEVGMIGVNEGVFSCAEAAFGGVKESGLGREGGSRGVDEFTDWKYVCLGGMS